MVNGIVSYSKKILKIFKTKMKLAVKIVGGF